MRTYSQYLSPIRHLDFKIYYSIISNQEVDRWQKTEKSVRLESGGNCTDTAGRIRAEAGRPVRLPGGTTGGRSTRAVWEYTPGGRQEGAWRIGTVISN